jgi:hypothetical protein
VILNDGQKLVPETKKAANYSKCAEKIFKEWSIDLPLAFIA